MMNSRVKFNHLINEYLVVESVSCRCRTQRAAHPCACARGSWGCRIWWTAGRRNGKCTASSVGWSGLCGYENAPVFHRLAPWVYDAVGVGDAWNTSHHHPVFHRESGADQFPSRGFSVSVKHQPTNQPINPSINQPINQSIVNQSINQSIMKSIQKIWSENTQKRRPRGSLMKHGGNLKI